MASSRTFGVEIECGHNHGYGWVSQQLKREKIPHLSVGFDGSGVEVRTRKLQGEKGFEELKELFDALNGLGCYVSTRDGQHIHLGALDFYQDAEARERLLRSYVNNRDHILPFVHSRRHLRDRLHQEWEYVLANNIRQQYGSKGWDVNLRPLQTHKRTIEVRLHEGILDYEKSRTWVEFWIDFLDTIQRRKTPMPRYTKQDTLLRMSRTHAKTKAKLKAAQRRYAHA